MRSPHKINFLVFFFPVALFFSCGPEQPVAHQKKLSKAQTDSMIIEMETRYNQMEEDRIRDYISRHAPMERAPSGYWYLITKKNEKGKKIEDLSLVRYSRIVSLCNSQEVYRDTNIVKVGNGQEITGMHAAMKMMKSGESALFIFPSYLAHGLLGDMNKIPPKSEVVYEVTILDVK
jgi:FKBP-type peptidyl-prolyl cis-trans isomerase FkpA